MDEINEWIVGDWKLNCRPSFRSRSSSRQPTTVKGWALSSVKSLRRTAMLFRERENGREMNQRSVFDFLRFVFCSWCCCCFTHSMQHAVWSKIELNAGPFLFRFRPVPFPPQFTFIIRQTAAAVSFLAVVSKLFVGLSVCFHLYFSWNNNNNNKRQRVYSHWCVLTIGRVLLSFIYHLLLLLIFTRCLLVMKLFHLYFLYYS